MVASEETCVQGTAAIQADLKKGRKVARSIWGGSENRRLDFDMHIAAEEQKRNSWQRRATFLSLYASVYVPQDIIVSLLSMQTPTSVHTDP